MLLKVERRRSRSCEIILFIVLKGKPDPMLRSFAVIPSCLIDIFSLFMKASVDSIEADSNSAPISDLSSEIVFTPMI
jgi:hypothetical protein